MGAAMLHDWLHNVLHEARCVELRHLDGDHISVGVFDDLDLLRAAIRHRRDTGNLYCTVNRVADHVVADNHMHKHGSGLRDADMVVHTKLLFDFDPQRPRGVPATDDEVVAALRVRNRVVQVLLGLGWPVPAMGCSGNGGHLVYRVRLPVNDTTTEMFAALYRGLRHDFDSELVTFDTTVRNASRIWRVYGSTNRKGTPTEKRPHRVAQVTIPDRWEVVSPRLITEMADHYAKTLTPKLAAAAAPRAPVHGKGDYKTLDMVAWFTAHNAYRRRLGRDKHAVVCPWEHEHSSESGPLDTSTVVFEGDGSRWPAFHCSHQHCEGRDTRAVMDLWQDADAFCASEWKGQQP